MRISNFGIQVLHVKVKYWRIFCDVIFLVSQVFIVSSNRVSWEVSMKKNKKIYGSVFVIWLYLQKAMYRPCDLGLWPMNANFLSILYKFQIDISSNSREKNTKILAGHTDTQTDRQTRWKQYLATPSGGEVIKGCHILTHPLPHHNFPEYTSRFYIDQWCEPDIKRTWP